MFQPALSLFVARPLGRSWPRCLCVCFQESTPPISFGNGMLPDGRVAVLPGAPASLSAHDTSDELVPLLRGSAAAAPTAAAFSQSVALPPAAPPAHSFGSFGVPPAFGTPPGGSLCCCVYTSFRSSDQPATCATGPRCFRIRCATGCFRAARLDFASHRESSCLWRCLPDDMHLCICSLRSSAC